jgi:hypothetical protein
MIARTIAMVLFLLLAPRLAAAVTMADLVALSKAGVSPEVLVAVIEADRTVFSLTADDIRVLKQAGVADAVLLKMLGSAQEFVDEVPPPLIVGVAPPARVVPSALAWDTPAAMVPVVPYPALIPYPVFIGVPVLTVPLTFEMRRGFGRFINDGWIEGRGFGRFINTP